MRVPASETIEQLKYLKDLALREHYTCEDGYYNCPASMYAYEYTPDGCDCGADQHNKIVNKLYEDILATLF